MPAPTIRQLEHLARQAGAILRDGYDKEHQVDYKGVIDLVTEVDRASEDYLLGEIKKHWPDSYIMSEESGVTKG
ncbi:MAG: inositol monophosphatase family protein, partial [Anaerolineales bacterium]